MGIANCEFNPLHQRLDLILDHRWREEDTLAPSISIDGLISLNLQPFGIGKRGLFRRVHFLGILENLEILEILENPQTVENKGDSDHFLEILENLEILEILEISPAKRPLS